MILGCLEILSLIGGLVILIRGKFDLFSKRKLEGKPARIVGLILMLPGPLSMLGGYLVAFIIPDEPFFSMPNVVFLIGMEGLIFVGALVAATLVAWKIPRVPVATLPSVLTIAEVADYLSLPEEKVLQLIEQGDLPARRVGDEYRLDREVLIEFARKRDSISLREMIGSINPIVLYVIIGAIIVVIIGLIGGLVCREGRC